MGPPVVKHPRLFALGWAGVVASAVGAGCGSRSGVELSDPCDQPGQTRPCTTGCGPGLESCSDGFWQACQPLATERPCQNDCGDGVERCESDRWQSCNVPIATRACSNDCGVGTQSCRDGAWAVECDVPEVTRECSSVCGSGKQTCRDSTWGACDAPLPKPPRLLATVRDFHASHPDFEIPLMGDNQEDGIVADLLGPDDKPVYNGHPFTRTTSGVANFNQWYNDVPATADSPAVNMTATIELQLVASRDVPGQFEYDDTSFFPIDGDPGQPVLFGKEGYPHNYHFTLETHTHFKYVGGEHFAFAGDDDMWVFINRRLAIDLGGIHSSLSEEVALDDIRDRFGLVLGQVYPLDFFFAERHTIASDFTIRTTIADPGSCD